MYYLGQKKGVELGVTAGAVNALGSTVDNAGNKLIQVKSKHADRKYNYCQININKILKNCLRLDANF